MLQLVDMARPGKRHLNGIQRFRKTVWIKPWTRSTEAFEHRRPRPVTAPDFYDDFISNLNADENGEKAKLSEKQKTTFGKFLNGTYYTREGEGPSRQWQLVIGVSVEQAKELMEFRPATIWNVLGLGHEVWHVHDVGKPVRETR